MEDKLSQFLTSLGACFYGLDESAAEGSIFEGVDACDGGTARRADHGAQVAGAFAGLLDQFYGAFDGTEGKLQRYVAGEARFYAAAGKAFDEFEDVGGGTTGKSGDGVHQAFGDSAGDSDGVENS